MQTPQPQSLKSLIGALSLDQVARVIDELLRQLDVIGRGERVHGCLSPVGVAIGAGGEVELTDQGSDTPAGRCVTGPGAQRSDAHYISPEQVLGRVVTPAADMYSIGCMAYEMLVGRPPFEEQSPIALLSRQARDPVPDVRELAPAVPEAVALWVARMTDKQPAQRYQDATAARESFERALGQPGVAI